MRRELAGAATLPKDERGNDAYWSSVGYESDSERLTNSTRHFYFYGAKSMQKQRTNINNE